MARKRKSLNQQELLDVKLSELATLVKDCSAQSRVEISFPCYEDEDAAIDVYPPLDASEEDVRRLEVAVGERCNDILVDTGLFIVGAVRT